MELTASAAQTVTANSNVLFNETIIKGCNSIIHRSGSGLVTLRGITNQCKARFKVYFNGNVAAPTGGTIGEISVAISIAGEPLSAATMIVTPAAVEEFFNISSETYIEVPKCCCTNISVQNIGTQSITVQNANIVIERVA